MGRTEAESPGPAARLEVVLLDLVAETEVAVPLPDLLRAAILRSGGSRREVRAALNRLVRDRFLEYVHRLGVDGVGRAFGRPVPVSPRLELVPAGVAPAGGSLRRPVILSPAAAFGDGRHPTTQLVLEGLDAWCADRAPAHLQTLQALDIGTGTGVLALALGRLGVGAVLALDHAAGAVAEARANAAANGLEAVITVTGQSVEEIQGRFSLVVANLRPPTLIALTGTIGARLVSGGTLILSGFRASEAPAVLKPYLTIGMELMTGREKGGWAAVSLRFPPSDGFETSLRGRPPVPSR